MQCQNVSDTEIGTADHESHKELPDEKVELSDDKVELSTFLPDTQPLVDQPV